MKTFVECSWLLIWVPTRDQQYEVHQKKERNEECISKQSSYFDFEKEPQIAEVALRTPEQTGCTNHGFVLDRVYEIDEMTSNSGKSKVQPKLSIKNRDRKNTLANIQDDSSNRKKLPTTNTNEKMPVKSQGNKINEKSLRETNGDTFSQIDSSTAKGSIVASNNQAYENQGYIPDHESEANRKESNSSLPEKDVNSAILKERKHTWADIQDGSFDRGDFESRIKRVLNRFQRLKKIEITPKIFVSNDAKFTCFSFSVENHNLEDMVLFLEATGIGTASNTSISVIPASLHLEQAIEENCRKRYSC